MDALLDVPLVFAFSAGMLASINPCGFAMLPAFVSYFVGTDDGALAASPPLARLKQALAVAGAITTGFLLVFGIVGGVVSLGARSIIQAVPWASLLIGIGLASLGAAMLLGKTWRVKFPNPVPSVQGHGFRPMLLYGVSYAVASLSCTLPIFLVVVAGSLAASAPLASFGLFVAYGLGMGTVLLAVTIGATLFRGVVAAWLRPALPYVERLSAAFLVVAGLYLVSYQVVYTLRWVPV